MTFKITAKEKKIILEKRKVEAVKWDLNISRMVAEKAIQDRLGKRLLTNWQVNNVRVAPDKSNVKDFSIKIKCTNLDKIIGLEDLQTLRKELKSKLGDGGFSLPGSISKPTIWTGMSYRKAEKLLKPKK